MAAGNKVAVTDYSFDELDVEKAVLGPLGCQVVGQKSGKDQQQLVANGIAIRPFLSSVPEDRLGLGLYPVTAAVLNHSCDPNCSIRSVQHQQTCLVQQDR